MIRLLRWLGRVTFFLATAAFLTAVSLLLLGSFLLTWPIMRKTPRSEKIKATADLAAATVQAIGAFLPEEAEGSVTPEPDAQ